MTIWQRQSGTAALTGSSGESENQGGSMDQKLAYFWCTYLQMIAPVKVRRLLEQTGGPEAVFGCTDEQLQAYGFTQRERKIYHSACQKERQVEEAYEKICQKGIRFVTAREDEFPHLLREVADCPVGLFVKGRLPSRQQPCVAMVGARSCSSYGRECAAYFASVLAASGVQIISGMAYGIDCCSQRAAQKEGSSFAVLGGGVDICYPRENIDLYEQLIAEGGVLSEMQPGTGGIPVLFPRRNRIISGMCEAVVVVEARKKSGSLITAGFAAEQGRYVYAIPGNIRSGLSEGCHELIRSGAILLQSPEELLEDLHVKKVPPSAGLQAGEEPMNPVEEDVYRFMEMEPLPMELLLRKTGYPAGTLSGALLGLELKGYICQDPVNQYRRTRRIPPSEKKACIPQKMGV